MGEYFSAGIAFDDVARLYGKAVAQEWWTLCGGTGDYVPGYTACPSMSDNGGGVSYGGGDLKYCHNVGGGRQQFWDFDKFIKQHKRIPQPGK